SGFVPALRAVLSETWLFASFHENVGDDEVAGRHGPVVVRVRIDEDGFGQKARLGQIDPVSLRVTTRATAFRSHGFSFLLRWRSQRTGLLSRRGAGAEAASVR